MKLLRGINIQITMCSSLVIYCCITILPPTQWLKTTYIYNLTVFVYQESVHSLTGSSALGSLTNYYYTEGGGQEWGLISRLIGEGSASKIMFVSKIQFVSACWIEDLDFLWAVGKGYHVAFSIMLPTTWQPASSKPVRERGF